MAECSKDRCAEEYLHLRHAAQCGDAHVQTYVWRRRFERRYRVNRVDGGVLQEPRRPWGNGLKAGQVLVLDEKSLEKVEKRVDPDRRYRT